MTPLIRLHATRRVLDAAQQACAHWDYESHEAEHQCCNELRAAERAHNRALTVYRRQCQEPQAI